MIFRILSLLLASMFFVACGDDDGERNGADEDETPRDEGRDNDYASIAAGYCALEYECKPDSYSGGAEECESTAVNELEHAERYVSECSEGMQNIMRCVATMSDCEEYQAFRLAPEESRCANEDARVVEHCGWHF